MLVFHPAHSTSHAYGLKSAPTCYLRSSAKVWGLSGVLGLTKATSTGRCSLLQAPGVCLHAGGWWWPSSPLHGYRSEHLLLPGAVFAPRTTCVPGPTVHDAPPPPVDQVPILLQVFKLPSCLVSPASPASPTTSPCCRLSRAHLGNSGSSPRLKGHLHYFNL